MRRKFIKKLIQSMTAALLVLSTMLGAGVAYTSEVVYAATDENETGEASKIDLSADVIKITSPEEFYAVAKKCTLDSWSKGKTIELANDITLTSNTQTKIPYFGGTFNGKKHTISGLTLSGNDYPLALFGVVGKGATIKDLYLEGYVHPQGDEELIASLVGRNNGQIKNCHFTGNVNGKNNVGGLVGINDVRGQIINSSFSGSVTGEHYVGGIAGQNLGSIIQCTNKGEINTSQKEVSLDIDSFDFNFSKDSLTETSNVAAGTDIGGITGYSSGLIQTCINTGNVGYQHVGYNVGGIVGRQTGYVDNCSNEGLIKGRKDVGGIAGQMEPNVTLVYDQDTLDELYGELDDLGALVDKTIDDADAASDNITTSINSLNSDVEKSKDAVADLSDAITDYANDNIDNINDASARISWTIAELDPVMGDMSDGLSFIKTATEYLNDAFVELKELGEISKEEFSEISLALKAMSAACDEGKAAFSLLESAMTDLKDSIGDPDEVNDALKRISDALGKIGDAMQDIGDAAEKINTDALDIIAEVRQFFKDSSSDFKEIGTSLKEISEAVKVISDNIDTEKLKEALQKMSDASGKLKNACDKLSAATDHLTKAVDMADEMIDISDKVVDALSKANTALGKCSDLFSLCAKKMQRIFSTLADKPTIQVKTIGEEITGKADNVNNSFSKVLDGVGNLNSTLASSTDVLLADMRAVNSKLGDIVDLLKNSKNNISGDEASNHYEDISDELEDEEEEPEDESGRISRSKNSGRVEGDLDVAGIVGSLAIEYDFDPEDDLTKSGNRSLSSKYQTIAVVRECINKGYILAKKKYAATITGKMELGSLRDCEGYGFVVSEAGDYIGGIVGFTTATVRRCYSKANLFGVDYIGGIVGDASEDAKIYNCVAIAKITEGLQYLGAISGTENGKYKNNLFVSENLAGLGQVSYEKKAKPISIDELLKLENIPDEMKTFNLRFVVDEAVVSEQEFEYGESFDETVYPKIQAPEGCFVKWDVESLDNLNFDTVVTAEYIPFVTTLSSDLARENGRNAIYVQGQFDDKQVLVSTSSYASSQSVSAPLRLFYECEADEIISLSIPDDGNKTHLVRFLPKNDKAKEYKLYVKDGKDWKLLDTESIGKYLTFELEENDVEILAVSYSLMLPLIIALVTFFVIVAVVFIIVLVKKRKKKRTVIDMNQK